MNTNNIIKYAIMVIFIFSILCKVFLGFYWRDSFFERGNNYSVINPIAENLIKENRFDLSPGNPSIEHEFFYPVLVAGCYVIFGINWFGITLLQSLLSGLTALIVFSLCKKLFHNKFIAFGSFFLTLFHPYLFIHALSIADTTLFVFLVALLCLLIFLMKERPTLINAVLLGVVLAIAILTRDSAIVFIFPVGIYLILVIGKNHASKLLLVLLTIFIFVTPWIIRNYLLTRRILLSSHGYEVVWQGNNAYAWDYISKDISVDKIPKPSRIAEIQSHSSKRTIETVLAERSAYLEETKVFIAENPITFLSLLGLKFIKFWSWNYNPKPESTTYLSVKLRSIIYTCYFLPLLLFGIMGILTAYQGNKKYIIFCLMILASFTVIHMISVGFTRLRLPLDPLLSIFSSYGIYLLIQQVRHKRLQIGNSELDRR